MNAIKERRFKIIDIDQQSLVEMFNELREPMFNRSLPMIDGLPKDAYVVSAEVNFCRRSISLIVASEEFEPAEQGREFERIPDHPIEWKHEESLRKRAIEVALSNYQALDEHSLGWIADDIIAVLKGEKQ